MERRPPARREPYNAKHAGPEAGAPELRSSVNHYA